MRHNPFAPLLLALAAACATGAADRAPSATRADSSAGELGGVAAAPAPTPVAGAPAAPDTGARRPEPAPAVIRGLYVNRYAAQTSRRLHHLIGIADTTEVNALVIDVKDEFGLNFRSADPMLKRNAGDAGAIRDVRALVDTLRAHGIVPIARIVVFKDSVAARLNPEHVIRREDGTPWRDKKGITWVNPYDRQIWEYNIRVAEEMVRAGFPEIQFDYIRFPEPFPSLPKQVFPGASGSKPAILAAFLKEACGRIHKLGARCTADIFGLVTTVNGALEVGQEWEVLSPVVDVLLPMTYPSHYPPGSFGIPRPNAEPYKVVSIAIKRAHERDAKLGVTTPEHVRPWIQAFSLGKPEYGPEQITAQKQAIYDAGYKGWILWSPGSHYDVFVPALAPEAPRAGEQSE